MCPDVRCQWEKEMEVKEWVNLEVAVSLWCYVQCEIGCCVDQQVRVCAVSLEVRPSGWKTKKDQK